jgi:predicted ester cyclase
MTISWLGKFNICVYALTGADPSKALSAWTRLVNMASLPDVRVNWDVVISTGQRIATRLDLPGRRRSMALVRSRLY